MNRRALLAGASLAAVSRAFAQPMPILGPVGAPPLNAGPLWSLGSVPPGVTLDLSFMTPGTLPSGVTFTRASTATYFDSSGVLRTAAANAPRWDYNPTTHALNGLLIEEARTNLWLQSADASNAAWSSSGSAGAPVVTGNQAIAPDGTTTAARVAYPAVSAGAYSNLAQQPTLALNPYSLSVWLRGSVGGERLYLMTTADAVTYYRQQATLTTAWQRFTVITPSISGGYYWQIGTDLRDGGQTGTPAQTVYVWGAQVEAGAFPTSYIPTTAAAVTRAQDNASMPTGAWFNPAASSLLAEYSTLGAIPDTGVNNREACVLSDGTTANRIALRALGSGTSAAYFYSAVSGAATVSTAIAPVVAGVNKLAAMWNGTAPRGVLNNGTIVSYSSALPAGINVLTIGNQTPGGAATLLNGYIRRVRYWPRPLSNAELQSVTT